jgi:hypothetical protein
MKDRRVIVLLVCCLVCTGLLMVTPSAACTLILGHGAAPGSPDSLELNSKAFVSEISR